MAISADEIDVLVVGAGPVGLFLANECARRGLRSRLVETRAAQSEHSKALAIFSRTLEIFDMAGVVAPFLAAANRVTQVAVVAGRRRLANVPFVPDDTPYPFVAMVPQDVTERLLADALARRGVAVEYDTTLVAAVQQGERVTATLERAGSRTTVTAGFLVGCDGAHSAVRRLLGLPFAGGAYEDEFMLADIDSNQALPADEMQLCPSEFGPLAIFPMSATRRRVVAMVDRRDGEAPSLDLVRKLLAERGPPGVEALSMRWSSYFHIHHRRVERLGVGRMFVAGDAAHIHSPFGGQGMNTGLQDAWNLAWKLDLAARGRGDARLLDSYTVERSPVIKSVVETTDFITRAMGARSRLAQALRDVAIPLVSRLAPFRRAFVRRLSQLDIAYGASSAVSGGGGQRYVDDALRGGGCFSFLLFVGADVGASTREAAQRLSKSSAGLVELRGTARAGVTLVRPDGYVACASGDTLAAAQQILQPLLRQP